MKAIYTTKSPEETVELGGKLAGRLKGGDTVLLYGDLGTGKTHFIKGVAAGLGVDGVVKSPTYAYVNQYPLDDGLILHHYDLYRFEEGGDVASIGFEESVDDSKAINVVEWADRLGEELPKRYARVELGYRQIGEIPRSARNDSGESGTQNNTERTIAIEFISPAVVLEGRVDEFYEQWATPVHVQGHCKQVTNVAMQIAEAYVRRGEVVNMNLLYSACMLHDMARICDFKELDRDDIDRFQEEVTDEKWEKWQSCRAEFKGMHHADITAQILLEQGFTESAEVIRLHKSRNIVQEPDAYDALEKQIAYYADKRVKHDQIVDLAERFEDGRERHGRMNTPEDKQLYEQVEKRTYELEDRLLEGLEIGAEDIK